MSYPSAIEYDTAAPLMYPFLNHGQFLCLTLTWKITSLHLMILSFFSFFFYFLSSTNAFLP